MKKLLVLALVCLAVVSCKKDDDNNLQNRRVIELLEKLNEKLYKTNEEIDSVEYKTVFVEFDKNISRSESFPTRGYKYKKAESKVSELLNNGWQIISTSDVIFSEKHYGWYEVTRPQTATLGVNLHLIKNWKKKDLELLKEKEKIKLDSIRKVEIEVGAEAEKNKEFIEADDEVKSNIKKRKL